MRTFFVDSLQLIESSEPARRVADALRDLEASFLITSQKQQWLDGEREDWLETVRLVARVVDRPLITFGLLRVIGSLLNDLAMSLKEGSFIPAFTRPRTAVHATRRSLWHARVEAILISGIATDERDVRVLEERYFSDVLRLRAPEASAQTVLLNDARFVAPTPREETRVVERDLRLAQSYNFSTDVLMRRQETRRRCAPRRLTISEEDDDDPYSADGGGAEELERLRGEVARLQIEREQEVLCTICYSNKRDTVVCPCLHLMYCSACIVRLRDQGGSEARCPHCRCAMTGLLQIFS